MDAAPIPKSPPADGTTFNLTDYDSAVREFSWAAARARLDGLPGGRGLNIAHEAVDRHADGPRAGQVALRCVAKDGTRTDLTYADLREQTNRFANLLGALGVGKGDRVFSLLGRMPELYIAALGTLKNTSVFSPLFSAFGPEPIRDRLRIGDAKVLVTTAELYERRIAPIRDSLPGLEHVLIVGQPTAPRRSAWPRRWPDRARSSRSRQPTRRTWRCCTSPAARPASPRARCTCTRPSWRTTRPRPSRSTCGRTTCSGARPIPAGSPGPPTASSRRSRTA